MTHTHGKAGISATGAPEQMPEAAAGHTLTRRGMAGGLLVILSLVILFLPSPYVIETPGPTQDVLGRSGSTEVVSVKGGQTYTGSGKLLLTTINAGGLPGSMVTNMEALLGWANPKAMVVPREAIIPEGMTADEYRKQEASDMSGSQDAAAKAAISFLKAKGYQTDGIEITMHVDDIGGPSAGMMYALGAIDKLTPEDETGGRTIAGTGTIDEKGAVGAIGGINLKLMGAKRDGATWFLAPKANCSQVAGHVPDGLRDVQVETLDQAYKAVVEIGHGRGEDLPRCTVDSSSPSK